jgi:UDP:flavonoid glycosyltransferase YjiC (YdhE family)
MANQTTQPAVNRTALPKQRDSRYGTHAAEIVSATAARLRKRALFIPASIRSHIVPTLYVAELLASEYDVFYAVTDPVLAAIVSENGFTPVLNSAWRVAIGMEPRFLASQGRGTGFWPVIQAVHANELYWQRKRELDELLDRVKPAVVIIDIFSSTDFLVLYHHRATVQLLFCNPMPSTYRIGNLPIVSEANWSSTSPPTNTLPTFNWRNALRNPGAELYQAAMRYQVVRLAQLVGLRAEHELVDTPFTRLFTNVPELILAPLEFELSSKVRKPHQHYLGLCIRETRTDTELDEEFERQWAKLLERQQTGQRLIYCSFGTFYTGSNKALLNFITNLLGAISAVPDVQLICSVNGLVVETLQTTYAALPNVHFFRRVPQLVVLKSTAVHITHGGLGSIKESIRYGVPMLVYPLDLHYDQPGNSLKIEYHGLGLRGDFNWERAATLKEKLIRLLNDATFQDNLARFRQTCATRYADNKVKDILRELLAVAAP